MILESKFQCFTSAFECTQFIRGELYVYMDSLLTLPMTITPSDIKFIIDFTRSVFRLILTWIDI